MKQMILCSIPMLLICVGLFAQELKPVSLPAPTMTGGKPLLETLNLRQSTREFSTDSLSLSVLSNLLWAACGVNRPESGKRTAPSARNWQEVDVYIVTAQGVYRYEPVKHELIPVLDGDHRAETGMQEFVAIAPVNLVYVADYSRMKDAEEDQKEFYSATDAGSISQNVYLFCASEGLGTVVRGSVDRDALAKSFKLSPDQHVVLAQTVGYPKK